MGFTVTGIEPFNPKVYGDEFLASFVNDRPEPVLNYSQSLRAVGPTSLSSSTIKGTTLISIIRMSGMFRSRTTTNTTMWQVILSERIAEPNGRFVQPAVEI